MKRDIFFSVLLHVVVIGMTVFASPFEVRSPSDYDEVIRVSLLASREIISPQAEPPEPENFADRLRSDLTYLGIATHEVCVVCSRPAEVRNQLDETTWCRLHDDDCFSLLPSAAGRRHYVRFDYPGETRGAWDTRLPPKIARQVRPIAVGQLDNGSWVLKAIDENRRSGGDAGFRVFKLARLTDLQILHSTFEPYEEPA